MLNFCVVSCSTMRYDTTHMHDTHTYLPDCMHTCINTCIHVCMHTCTHANMHTCIHVCMHVCIHTCMHTYIKTLCEQIKRVLPSMAVLLNFVGGSSRKVPKSTHRDIKARCRVSWCDMRLRGLIQFTRDAVPMEGCAVVRRPACCP